MTIKAKRHYATRPGYALSAGGDGCGMTVSISASSLATPRASELLLYAQADSPEPFQVIALDPELNHSFFFWHVFVVGLSGGHALHLAGGWAGGCGGDRSSLQRA